MKYNKNSKRNDNVYEEFKRMCPHAVENIIDWFDGQDRFEIFIIMNDGSAYMYDSIYKGFKKANSFEDLADTYKNNEQWKTIFARRLYRRMCVKGKSQDILSYETGISTCMINRYCNAESMVSGYNLIKIAEALECTVNDLVYFD